MGMFDNIICKYPLPLDGANALDYQTKDTPAQYLDLYEIREDGTLWHQLYDIEDRSDPTKEGLERLIGCLTRTNKRWEKVNFTGDLSFYTFWRDSEQKPTGWIEWMALYDEGVLLKMKLVEDRKE